MPHLSKKSLRRKTFHRVSRDLIAMISGLESQREIKTFLTELLTPTERVMLAKRLSIALLLLKKYDQRTVARILNVSLGTVNKVSLALQKGNGGYELVVNSIVRQEKFHAFLEKIDETLVDIVTTGHSLPNWRRVRWETKIRNRKPY